MHASVLCASFCLGCIVLYDRVHLHGVFRNNAAISVRDRKQGIWTNEAATERHTRNKKQTTNICNRKEMENIQETRRTEPRFLYLLLLSVQNTASEHQEPTRMCRGSDQRIARKNVVIRFFLVTALFLSSSFSSFSLLLIVFVLHCHLPPVFLLLTAFCVSRFFVFR